VRLLDDNRLKCPPAISFEYKSAKSFVFAEWKLYHKRAFHQRPAIFWNQLAYKSISGTRCM
jgi:hypothetical protein